MKDMKHHGMKGMYVKLAIMAVLSFISMYVFMYMMVYRFAEVYPNVNQFYMAGLMSAPMVIIEILVMWSMYTSTKANFVVVGVSLLLLVLFIAGMRYQTAVSDTQFLKSMIPHHSGALLMCDNPNIRDAEIRELCKGIIASQQSEIDWMKQKLKELESK